MYHDYIFIQFYHFAIAACSVVYTIDATDGVYVFIQNNLRK